MIGLVAMVLVVIASWGSVVLVRTCPHWWGPLEIREVPDNREEPVIGDVERGGGGGGSFFFSDCSSELLALALAAFLFGWALGGQLVAMGCYHNNLRSGPDVIF